ncbi:MAG: hydrogenase small subunit [Anaeromyxobacteraceae bacterium]|nr:hydrogenase small subunit [Anaeromyxobacteraceae bacterium]
MLISRRSFLRWASTAAGALGLTPIDLFRLERALADGRHPPIIWIQGAVCTGCSVSLLNATAPEVGDVLTGSVDLVYHPTLMALAGEQAMAALVEAADRRRGEFILCVEGGIPTSHAGAYTVVGERGGRPLTALRAVQALAPRARHVLAVGTCASFGGVVKPSRYTGVRRLDEILAGSTRAPVINLPSCPSNPIVLLGTLVELLTGGTPRLDTLGRPEAYYAGTVHHLCPRLPTPMVDRIGVFGCYEHVGCKGPHTGFTCPNLKWNDGVNWCIDKTNTLCIGCSSPAFPQTPFYTKEMASEPCCVTCATCATCVDCSLCANETCEDCADCSRCTACLACEAAASCPDCTALNLCAECCAGCANAELCAACAKSAACPCHQPDAGIAAVTAAPP